MNSITKRQTALLYERRQLVVARALVGQRKILEGRRWWVHILMFVVVVVFVVVQMRARTGPRAIQ